MPIEHMDMKHPKIIVAGIGPGNESDITPGLKLHLNVGETQQP